MASRKGFWITAALVTAAIVLPFGGVLLIAGIAARKRKALRKGTAEPYAAWFRLREDAVERKN
ncbi:MAG: hypothetical protein HYR51_15440 [Candidatus Rokubacteria bacterium]|nr:hypothetical protein [Candidatus Rokubacteria bacterium]